MAAVQLENDLAAAAEALGEDRKFLLSLEKGCATKASDFECAEKARTAELLAIRETVKVLNDDDALELFKKTLPGAGSSFMEVEQTTGAQRARAMAAIVSARRASSGDSQDHFKLDLIMLALRGKKIGFEKVIKMIDNMVELLKKEQLDDDDKKEYCNTQFDTTDDARKALERTVSDLTAAIASTEGSIATLSDEIAALGAGIKALDKAVEEASEQRKDENAAFKEIIASNHAAKELLKFAKNRLNKFYSPKLYIPPAKRELSAGDRIFENEGGEIPAAAAGGIAGTGIAMLVEVSEEHKCPNFQKKSEETAGVMAMIDLLIQDLDKENAVAQTEEKDAQSDFEATIAEAKSKREADSKLLTEKTAAVADMKADLQAAKASKTAKSSELSATLEYIASLHAECDWLIKYFDARKAARSGEVDSLVNAKAILSGADFSLMQTKRALRH